MIKTTVQVAGMACGMCESHVNEAIRNAFSVKKVTSSHAKNLTEIVSEEELDADKIRAVISETGYELVSMNKTKEKTLLDSDVALTVVLDMKSTTEHQNVLDAFNNLDYVNYLEEI